MVPQIYRSWNLDYYSWKVEKYSIHGIKGWIETSQSTIGNHISPVIWCASVIGGMKISRSLCIIQTWDDFRKEKLTKQWFRKSPELLQGESSFENPQEQELAWTLQYRVLWIHLYHSRWISSTDLQHYASASLSSKALLAGTFHRYHQWHLGILQPLKFQICLCPQV